MKKCFKIVSVLLIICFCASFLTPIGTVQARASDIYALDKPDEGSDISRKSSNSFESLENVINIPVEELRERYQMELQNPERDYYMEIMSKLTRFSEASKQELEFLSTYLGVDHSLLIEAEKLGYSVADSILAAKIRSSAKLTYEEIEKGLLQYKDLRSLYTESRKYANLVNRWDFSAKTIETIKNHFLQGNDYLELAKPAVIVEIFNVDLNDIVMDKDEDNKIWSELEKKFAPKEILELSTFTFENNISVKWFLDYTAKEKIGWTEFYKKVDDYYDKTVAKKDTGEKSIEPRGISLMSDEEEYKAPFSYEEYNEDRIEMNTGSLIYENIDVYLPGRNGLDFTLISRYDSEEHVSGEKEYSTYTSSNVTLYDVAIIYERYIYGGPYGGTFVEEGTFELIEGAYWSELKRLEHIYNNPDKKVFFTWEGTWLGHDVTFIDFLHVEVDNYYTVSGDYYDICRWFTPTYAQKDSPLGLGWSFVFDSIEIVSSNSYYNNFLERWTYYLKKKAGKFLHLEDGQVYEIGTNLELIGYKLDDMWLEQDTSYTNEQNVASYYVLKYKDGLKKYFAQDGRLLAKVDRYGNTIEYQHTLIRNHPVITKIIDTLGREVTIDYDFNNLQVVVTAPGNRKIIYKLEEGESSLIDEETGVSYHTYSYRVVSRTDFENRVTTYEYNYNTHLSFYVYTSGTGILPSKILTKVNFPTGSYIEYEYADERRFLYGGFESYPQVKKRTMFEATKDVQHQREYINDNNYTRYPFVPDDKLRPELEGYYPQSYRFMMIDRKNITCVVKTREYKFNYNNQMTDMEEYRSMIFTIGSNGYLIKVDKYLMYNSCEFKYDSQDYQLVQTRTKTYTIPESWKREDQDLDNYLLKVEDYKYDKYANLTKYWGPEAARNSNNELINPETDNYLVKYTYDTNRFHLLTQKQYKQDSGTTISEIYPLTDDGKNVSQAVINVNGVQKSKTQYGYDQWNNINSEKRYLEDGGWINYIETNYSYLDNDPGRNASYDFDGAYLTSKSTPGVLDADGNPVGTIAETYKYDDYGNIVSHIDPENNETTYQYDSLGRLELVTNPDLTTIGYDRDDENNILTITDEIGTQIQYIYDGFGNLLYVKDVETGEYLKAYEYNKDFLLVTEKNNDTLSPNYCIIQYSYYNDGRVKTKTTQDSSGTIAQEKYVYEDAFDLNGDETADCSKVTTTVMGETGSPSIVSTRYMDKNGRIIREGRIHNESEYYTTYTYDYVGNRIREKSSRAYDEGWPETYTARYEYDYAGRITREYNVFGDYSSKEYDALGRMVSFTDIKANKAATPYSTLYEYDNLGRLLVERIPFEKEGSTIYYSTNKYYYDKNGNTTCKKTTNNLPGQAETYSKTEYEYNNRGFLTKVITYDGDTPENYTQYYYDAAGNKLRMYTGLSSPLTINGLDDVIPGSDTDYSVTRYEYDRFGNLTKMTDPLMQYETYTYDLNGNMIEKIDRNQNIITMEYDGLNRLILKSVETPDESGDKEYTYTYYLTGNRASMSGGGTDVTYTYDDLGRLIQESESGNITKVYGYDASDNRISFTLSKDSITQINTTYTYDKMNRLKEVKEDGQLKAKYTYDENGNRQKLEYSNGNFTTYTYNLANKLVLLENRKVTGGGSEILLL